MESLRVLKVLLLLTLIETTYSKVNSNDEFLFEVTAHQKLFERVAKAE